MTCSHQLQTRSSRPEYDEPAVLAQARTDAAEYGYTVGQGGRLYRNGTPEYTSGVILSNNGRRLQARNVATGALLWSGPRVGGFLEAFWFAEKVKA